MNKENKEIQIQDDNYYPGYNNYWYLDMYKVVNSPLMDSVIELLVTDLKNYEDYNFFPKQISYAESIMKCLRIIISNLFHAYSNDPEMWIDYTRDENSDYWNGRLSYTHVTEIINFLVANDYIHSAIGYRYGDNFEEGHRSKIRATVKLINLFGEAYSREIPIDDELPVKVERDTKEFDPIKFKGMKPPVKWEPVYYPNGGFKGLRKVAVNKRLGTKRKYVNTPDTREVRTMRDNINRINDLLLRTDIKLNVHQHELDELNRRLNSENDPYKRAVDFSKKTLHRVFLDRSPKVGGRFYGGWWQGIPKEYRKRIVINNQPTFEPDFSAYHINILYFLENIKPPKEYPYKLDGYSDSKDNIKFLKRALLVILNTKGDNPRSTVIRRLRHEIKQGTLVEPKEMEDIGEAIDKFAFKHEPISKYFYTGYGNTLQNIDSRIAEQLMLTFADAEIPILPVHDSFIIEAEFALHLQVFMMVICKHHLKKYHGVDIEGFIDAELDRTEWHKSWMKGIEENIKSGTYNKQKHQETYEWFNKLVNSPSKVIPKSLLPK